MLVVAVALVASSGSSSEATAGGGDRRPGNGHPAPPTILVVEDEILVRLAVADYLRKCGYRVLEASSGEEAQTILLSGEPVEILFSDVNLAGATNGFALARWTRERYPNIRICLTSGVAKMCEEAAGMCDGPLLRKPYSFVELSDHIKRMLGAFARRSG